MNTNSGPTALGTGLLALDFVVATDVPPFTCAGGSCGNVLAVLAHLGWMSYPIARLGDDGATEWLVSDLEGAGVSSEFIERGDGGSTPVIVQRVSEDGDGNPRHRFERVCPHCKAWFPSYKPVLVRRAAELTPELPEPKAFYFDRASAGSIALAQWSREQGALVVFEPSGWKDERLFRRAVEVSDVVKFAHDRMSAADGGDLDRILRASGVRLAVETRGAGGLRYRIGARGKWHELGSFRVGRAVDTAGAGDWTTAGLIFALSERGDAAGPLRSQAVKEALQFGQALAAINCLFLSARGAMGALSGADLVRMARDLTTVGDPPVCEVRHTGARQSVDVCPHCAGIHE